MRAANSKTDQVSARGAKNRGNASSKAARKAGFLRANENSTRRRLRSIAFKLF